MVLDELLENNEFKEKYFVNDLVGKKSKIILILESPHLKEIQFKVPAAGETGYAMTNILSEALDLNTCKPLGKIFTSQSTFAILNCCQVPMQELAYNANDLDEEFIEILKCFNTLRKTKVNVKRKKLLTMEIEQFLLDNFKSRLVPLAERHALFIPCGNMAQHFITKMIENDNQKKYNTVFGIPHPSFNNWFKSRYALSINRMIKEINKQF